MKLAFVHKRFGRDGGTEGVLDGLCRGLSQRGHRVDVFCAGRAAGTELPAGVELRSLRSRGPSSLWRALLLFFSARFAVRPADYDLVVHFGRTGPHDVYRSGGGCHRRWYELLVERARGRLQRWSLRLSPKHRFLLWHEAFALRHGARVVVPSELSRQDLIRAYGASAEAVTVLPNGVDLQRFHPCGREQFFAATRGALDAGPHERVLLFVGSDYWRKGLDRVLESLALLPEHCLLVVAGHDRRRPHFERLAGSMGLSERVSFVGGVEQLERLYAAADLLVLPTRYDPFANVSMEALSCGLPVVTSRSNGAVERVGDCAGVAVLEDGASADVLAETITVMLEPAAVQQRRRAARSAAEQFGVVASVERWERFLQVAGRERQRRG